MAESCRRLSVPGIADGREPFCDCFHISVPDCAQPFVLGALEQPDKGIGNFSFVDGPNGRAHQQIQTWQTLGIFAFHQLIVRTLASELRGKLLLDDPNEIGVDEGDAFAG